MIAFMRPANTKYNESNTSYQWFTWTVQNPEKDSKNLSESKPSLSFSG